MEVDELFVQALRGLSEAAGDLLRAGRDSREYVFASFDGASHLGMALIACDVANDLGGEVRVNQGSRVGSAEPAIRAPGAEAADMIRAARATNRELIVSLMMTKASFSRVLRASRVEMSTRGAVALWLERPIMVGHFRVIAILGEHVRASTIDAVSEIEDAPVSSSLIH
jgi:hypothetical protein